MEHDTIINCPRCQKRLRIPTDRGLLNVKCPDCQSKFFWEPSKGIFTKEEPKKYNYFQRIVPISLIVLIALILIIYYSKDNLKSPFKAAYEPKWVKINYSDLLDPNAIIRTGENLKSSLSDRNKKGAIQPFVDPYSFLLQPSIEMLSRPDQLPYSNVVDAYPIGSSQPAWVGIFRGGKILITTDYNKHARVFLIGNNPEEAYQKNYSIIRHCLNALVPSDGSQLEISVYAYQNDYEKSELHLNLNPHITSASAFPPKQLPLNISGLAAFFEANPEIQGGEIDRSKGLILCGKQGAKQTLAGSKITLADLAVAFRAVFHAGDNEAFISLDPNIDHTKVSVNFGGYLEDTRIGSVVLESDKRFKTITTGLDPNKFNDLRQFTRKYVPSFLSVAEQDLIDSSHLSHGKWIGTRFWFYPDSIGIEADLNYQYALITNPIFKADAERSKDDFTSPEEFEKKKNSTLSPSIRHNIDHLNQNYAQYAQAFSELKELTTVARLMGICSWLYKVKLDWLDLDALLSVELPPFSTPREKTQLLSACFISSLESEDINQDYVIEKSKVLYLSPVLDKKVSEYFLNSSNFAKYLCIKDGEKEDQYKNYEAVASQLFQTQRNLKVREIIKSKEDLEALTSYSAHSLGVQKPKELKTLENDLTVEKENLQQLEDQIEQIKSRLNSTGDADEYNALVDHYNQLIYQHKLMVKKYNQAVNMYNSLGRIRQFSIIEIGGGINLEPRNFKIKMSPNSARLQGFRELMNKIGTEWRSLNGSGKWIKSGMSGSVSEIKNKLPIMVWSLKKEISSGSSAFKNIQSGVENQYWSASDSQTGSWRDCRKLEGKGYQERSYTADLKKLQIANYSSGKLESLITSQIDNQGRIIFQKSERKDVLKPQAPPIWFPKN